MSDWRETTLGQFVSLQRGHDLPSDKRTAGTVPVMGSFGITGLHNEARAPGPGVTIGRSGASIGVVSYIDRDYWPLNTCLFATDFHGNNPRFVYYFLQTLDLAAHNSGSAQPSLNRNYIRPIKISVPGRETQNDIASLIGSLDDKIELNRRMNQTLEAMAQAIFRDWFVDFGPTRRKLEGATNPVEIVGGLVQDAERAQALADLFPVTLGDDGLPEGWKESPFGEFVEIIGGGTPKTTVTEFWNGSIPWFSVVDTPEEGAVFVIQTEKSITEAGLMSSSARLVDAGTTIISARGTVGNLAIATEPMTFNQSCYALRGHNGVGNYFVYLASRELVNQLKSMAHGSVFSTITRATFEAISFSRSDVRIFSQFEEIASPLFEKIRASVFENRSLAATRDLLLPKLMSGEIRLSDAQHLMEAAQ
ncbi:restriction endonuclease subunit S [Rhizobium ruizarguesonis]|uniref:restriction endonuclease subunit S n=1 Tax=Rhizobium ruizarguesonis TaxID=2081791 RepID=UPI0010314BAD|nr:restriction endonuclease subunit S [Rhizobium ruizarguesonis]TBA89019.1 restriction endonuclease subunit S [Rhizobium ruizarguesonis]